MADEGQVAQLMKGAREWNAWRLKQTDNVPDLTHAKLAGARLSKANLRGANLEGADLSLANLSGADLTDANLTNATLMGATLIATAFNGANLRDATLGHGNLTGALLIGADLTGVNLIHANLNSAVLQDADLTGATLGQTVLGLATLKNVKGLGSCHHQRPSVIDHWTLAQAGPLPLAFLRGCGLPDRLIDYLPSLQDTGPIQFYSCFISYSTTNQDFANRLHADLQSRGVRCWFAPHDMSPGKKIHEQIDEAIRVYDRLLLILSNESMSSPWVKTEIAKARKKEVASTRRVLFPIALAPFSDIRAWEQFNADLGEDTAREIREYFVPDFSEWKTNHDAYQRSFEKIVAALSANDDVVGV